MKKMSLLTVACLAGLTGLAAISYQNVYPKGCYIGEKYDGETPWISDSDKDGKTVGEGGQAYPAEYAFTANAITGWKLTQWLCYKVPFNSLSPEISTVLADGSSYSYTWKYSDHKNLGIIAYLGARYDWIKYKLTYDANGGTFATKPADVSGILYTNSFKLAKAVVSRTGYVFDGWTQKNTTNSYKDQQSVTGASFTIPNHDDNGVVTLLAKWTPIKYSLAYELDGGTAGETMPNKATYDQVFMVSTPTRVGHVFTGWSIPSADEGTALYGSGDQPSTPLHRDTPVGKDWKQVWFRNLVAQAGEVVLIANWEKIKCKVTFNLDGGTGENSKEIEYGATDASVSCPTYKDHTFDGYYAGRNGTGQCYWDNKGQQQIKPWNIATNITVWAKWLTKSCTVRYDGNGATSGSVDDQKVTVGEKFSVKANGYKRDGYTFEHWQGQNNVRYVPSEEALCPSSDDGSVFVMTAVWTANKYVVTLENGSGVGATSLNVTYGQEPPMPSKPTWQNHAFTGYWQKADGSGLQYWDADLNPHSGSDPLVSPWQIAGNVTVYAGWRTWTYTVAYEKGDESATGSMDDQVCQFDTDCTLAANAFKRPGYVFDGWRDESYRKYGDRATVRNLGLDDGDRIVLTATWKAADYTVTFHDRQGETCGSLSVTNGFAVPRVAVPEPSERNPFGGYYSQPDAQGEQLWDAEGRFVPQTWLWTADVDVYAYAPEDPAAKYYIEYEGAGATNSAAMPVQECWRGETVTLNANAYLRPGHTFLHWTNTVLEIGFDDQAEIKDLFDRGTTNTLTAVWQANRYKVRFLTSFPAQGEMEDQQFVYGEEQALSPLGFSCGELYSFVGWMNTDSDGALLADRAVVSNLTEKAGGTIRLKAIWQSRLTDLSEAMECRNLVWQPYNAALFSGNPNVTNWYAREELGIGYDNDTAAVCAYDGLDDYDAKKTAAMTADVSSGGTLTFWYRMATDYQWPNYIRLNVTSAYDGEGTSENETKEFPCSTSWTKVSLTATNKPSVKLKALVFQLVLDEVEEAVAVYVDRMTWTPNAAHPEPTPEDSRDIAGFTVGESASRLSIADSDERFDYELLSSDDMQRPIAEWQVSERLSGNGSELTFEPSADAPCMFYRIRVMQKQDD